MMLRQIQHFQTFVATKKALGRYRVNDTAPRLYENMKTTLQGI